MRCLYCGKSLALFKKLTGGGEFCSEVHKQKYHEEYNRLALNRLMEAQTRQEEEPRRPLVETAAAPEKADFGEPTARGEYLTQPVNSRSPAPPAPVEAIVEPAQLTVTLPVLDLACSFEYELPAAGLVSTRGEAHGADAPVTASPVEGIAQGSVALALPEFERAVSSEELKLPEGSLIVQRQARRGEAAAPAGTAGGPLLANGAAPALPEFRLEPAGAREPERADLAEVEQPELAFVAAPEPVLMCEAEVVFQYSCEVPGSLDPEWIGGLEFALDSAVTAGEASAVLEAAKEAQPAEPADGVAVETAAAEDADTVEAAAPAEPPAAAQAAVEPELEPVTEAQSETAAAKSPERIMGMAPATAEPVINEDAWRALFGSSDDAEVKQPAAAKPAAPNAAAAKPAAQPEPAKAAQPVPKPAARAAEPAPAPKPAVRANEPAAVAKPAAKPSEPPPAAKPAVRPSEPEPTPAMAAGANTAPAPKPAVKAAEAAPAAPVVREPQMAGIRETVANTNGTQAKSKEPAPPESPSFVEVTIRPAAPGKPRLMQTFQAISLVTATPQIPAWNMLPLRPRMSLGREPGPGTTMLERRPQNTAPATPVVEETSTNAEDAMDLPVPSFASTDKPKSGLSRWFKLGIAIGVLGLAGSTGAIERPGAQPAQGQQMTWS